MFHAFKAYWKVQKKYWTSFSFFIYNHKGILCLFLLIPSKTGPGTLLLSGFRPPGSFCLLLEER